MAPKKAVKAISRQIESLSSISKEPVYMEVKNGATVIKEGIAGNFMFIIKDGAVDIEYKGIHLERVSAGGIVGEMAMVDDAQRSATVIARKKTILIPVSRERFMYLVRSNPEFALDVMNTMIRRMRRMNMRLNKAEKGKK